MALSVDKNRMALKTLLNLWIGFIFSLVIKKMKCGFQNLFSKMKKYYDIIFLNVLKVRFKIKILYRVIQN